MRITLLTTEEAAARLGVSVRTVKRWRSDVPLTGPPPIRIGNSIRYAEADVTSYVLAQREKARK